MIGQVLGCDVLVSILILLGPDSLKQACLVCKSWRSAVFSSEFRAAWVRRWSGPWVLLTPYYCYWTHLPRPLHVRLWNPISRTHSPLPPWLKVPFPPGTFDIVSSSSGLVLVRLPCAADDGSAAAEFAVGNPATDAWVRIPRLQHQKHRGRIYNLAADPDSGEFKVLDYMNEHVYHSSSRSWTRSKEVFGSVAGDRDALKELLVGEGREFLRGIDPGVRGILDREYWNWAAPFVWEHKGQHYIPQPIRNCDLDLFYRVLLLEAGGTGGCREVSCRRMDLTEVDAGNSMVFESHAEGNLVCVTGQCSDRYDNGSGMDGYEFLYAPDAPDANDAVPAAVYDVDANNWVVIRSTKEVHYRRAVVYHPSLVRPSGGGPLTVDPQQEHKLLTGLKRKKEQLEPDIPGFRQQRWEEVGEEVEVLEDIFFLGEEASKLPKRRKTVPIHPEPLPDGPPAMVKHNTEFQRSLKA